MVAHIMRMGLLLKILSNIKIPSKSALTILSSNRQKPNYLGLFEISDFGRI